MSKRCIWFLKYGDPQCNISVSTGYLCSIHENDPQFRALNEKLKKLDQLEHRLHQEQSQCQNTASYFRIDQSDVGLIISREKEIIKEERKPLPPPLPPRDSPSSPDNPVHHVLRDTAKTVAETEVQLEETSNETLAELEKLAEARGGPKQDEVEKTLSEESPSARQSLLSQIRQTPKLKPVSERKLPDLPEQNKPANVAQLLKSAIDTKFANVKQKEEESESDDESEDFS